jgi:oxygen-dependent protoporphyrinogen oxidase
VNPPARPRLLVIGAGIAGLATAWYARREAEKAGLALDLTVLEGAPRVGGKLLTRRAEGFVMEGGPDSFLTEKPWGLDLCRELGLGDDLVPSQDAQREFHLLRKGRFHRFPTGMRLFVPQQIPPLLTSGLLSWPGKLRLLLEPFIRPRLGAGDESLADFVTRRCGREAMERLAGPLLAGIYAADPDQLSMAGSFPFLVELERRYGSLTKGFRAAARKRAGQPPAPVFTSLRHGMEQLAETLADRLRDTLRLGESARALDVRGGRYAVTTDRDRHAADAVVLALPAGAAADLVRPFQGHLAEQLERLTYTTSLTVSLGYRQADLPHGRRPQGFGYMIPRVENQRLLGCTWSTNKFPGRSEEGLFLCRLFLAGAPAEEWLNLPDETLVAAARAESDRLTGIRATPVTSWVARWARGNPQYGVGHPEWLQGLDKTVATLPGFQLTGSSYRGVSMSDCIRDAGQVAGQVVRFLVGG